MVRRAKIEYCPEPPRLGRSKNAIQVPVIICREHAIHITSDASIYMTKRRVRVVMRGPEGRYPNKVFDIDLKSGTVEESLNANEPNPKWTKLRGPMA